MMLFLLWGAVILSVILFLVFLWFYRCVIRPLRHRPNNFFLSPSRSPRPSQSRRGSLEDESDDDLEIVFDPSQLKEEEYDCVIIGGGVSGLSTAAFVLQSDPSKSVVVLEKNEQLGGMCHTFFEEDGDYEFAPGVHFTDASFPTNMLWSKATEGRLKFAPTRQSMEDPVDHFHLAFDCGTGEKKKKSVEDDLSVEEFLSQARFFEMPGGRHELEDYLKIQFPACKARIARYFQDAWHCAQESSVLFLLREYVPAWVRSVLIWVLQSIFRYRVFRLSQISVKDHLLSIFPSSGKHANSHRHIRSLLGFYTAQCGLVDDVPAYVGMGTVFYVLKGGDAKRLGKVYPVGGVSQFGKGLCQTIHRYGGEAYAHASVDAILVDEGTTTANGVRMADGTVIRAKTVVSAIGLDLTMKLLPSSVVDKAVSASAAERSELCAPSLHFIQAFLGFDASPAELGLPNCDIVLAVNDVESVSGQVCPDTETANDSDLFTKVGFPTLAFVGNPNAVHTARVGRTALQLLIPSHWDVFSKWEHLKIKSRGSEYEELKHKLVDYWLERVFGLYPELRSHFVHFSIGSPLSSKHWTNWPKGEAYGVVCNTKRTFECFDKLLRPLEQNIHSLVIGSTDATIAPGVPQALFTGLRAAGKVVGRDFVLDLAGLVLNPGQAEKALEIAGGDVMDETSPFMMERRSIEREEQEKKSV